jgi:glutamate synthase (ferredoxin)
MAALGFRTVDEMVGRTEVIEKRGTVNQWKTHGLDFSQILYQPSVPESVGRFGQIKQDHGLEQSLDATTLLELCRPALETGKAVTAGLPIRNTNRAVGTIVGSEVTRRHGPAGLPDDTIRLHFTGTAGQSFGAFLPRGLTLRLEGDANDYVGKGLSGGKIMVYPPRAATFAAADNVIIGNVAFYGATAGEGYIAGIAGERFCVRNSGACVVVEGIGDHGCEYMTGGRVVVLGSTGRNFAAGMSGGIAYVLATDDKFYQRCNTEMVELSDLEDESEIETVRNMVFRHVEATGSALATEILVSWREWLPRIVRVIPNDYRRVLEARSRGRRDGLTYEQAVMSAFEVNSHDLARAGGR